jgi:hypothetical protein
MVKGYILITTLAIIGLISVLIIGCYQGLTVYTQAISALRNTENKKNKLLVAITNIKNISDCRAPGCIWSDLGYEPCLQIKTKVGMLGSHHVLVQLNSKKLAYQATARIVFTEKGAPCKDTIKTIKAGILSCTIHVYEQ